MSLTTDSASTRPSASASTTTCGASGSVRSRTSWSAWSTVSIAFDLHPYERPQHSVPVLGEKTLRMELHADDREPPVPNCHDLLRAVGGFGPGAGDEIGAKRVRADDEAVVAGRRDRAWQPLKNALSVVAYLVGL